MSNPPIVWKPHPGPQTKVLTRKEDEILYGGARGGGKTDAGLAFIARYAHIPEMRILVIRKNSTDLTDWIDRARELYSRVFPGFKFGGNPPTAVFPSGAKIITGHLKDDNAYTKYMGHEYQIIVIEELTHIASEDNYLKLKGSCRNTKVEGISPQMFCTTNPGNAGHQWVKERFVECADGERFTDEHGGTRIFIRSNIRDNPTLVEKDPAYVNYLNSLTGDLRKAWLEGDWDIFAGQYFAEFKRARHVIEPFEIPAGWSKFRMMDWGYNDPCASLWGAVNDQHVYIYRELYINNTLASEVAKQQVILTGGEDIDYTVASPDLWAKRGQDTMKGETLEEDFRNNGIHLLKADNARILGWQRVREFLADSPDGKPYLQIFSNCVNLIRELPALSYYGTQKSSVPSGKVEDAADGNDHAPEALRYGLMSRPSPAKILEEKKAYTFDWWANLLEEQQNKGKEEY